ncbi:MAG: glycosyltransferase, partial [Caldilineaceae bacterium]|nr:glycosyltransferase [Caldilineaceae bacterium]
EYLLQKRNALTDLHHPRRFLPALYSIVQWQKLRAYEARICRRADGVLAVSEPDQAALKRLVPSADVTVIANGIDAEAYQPAASLTLTPTAQTPATLVFTGKMDYRPNIDAVLWFADHVLPLIHKAQPHVRFQIVGMNPHPRLDRLREEPTIEITGAVEDIAPYLSHAGVYVVPLRIGGGTRFKVLEAMAQGLPIVSTTLGVEGIDVTDGQELLLADRPEAFAQAVLQILDSRQANGQMTTAMGNAARAFVTANYSWTQILPRLEALYQERLRNTHHATRSMP